MATVPVATTFREPFSKSSRGNAFGILPNSKFYGPQGHRGQDWVQPGGTPVPAIAAALVSEVVWSSALGNVVILWHNPSVGPDIYSFSCHLSKVSVRPGQVVKLGQSIGKVGTTGTASSGNHLHLAMSLTSRGGITGVVFDPLEFIRDHMASVAPAPAKPSKAKYTRAKAGEGLGAIAARTKTSLDAVKRLNPLVEAPEYLVTLGQLIRYV